MEQCNTQVPIVERLLRNDIRIFGIKPFCLASPKATRASQNAVISSDDQGPGQKGLPGHDIAEVRARFFECHIRVDGPVLPL